jgi:hypothetical protein
VLSKKDSLDKAVRIRNSTAEFLTFAYQTGGDGIEVRVQDGTIWLSQKNMSQLFDTTSDNIGLHLKNIFKEQELQIFSCRGFLGNCYRWKKLSGTALQS